jgi:glycine oxidase
VVGGGVCGLGVAWRLAAAGCAVDVFDKGEPGRAATWAAAGMLAARAEVEPGEEVLLRLNLLCQEMWPGFARELENATGRSVEYRDEGTLIVSATRDDAEALEFTYKLQRRLGLDVAWLTGAEARRREPFLSPGVNAGVYSPGDHQVDNRLLAEALCAACMAEGARLHANTPVRAVETAHGRVRGVRIEGNEDIHEADVVLLAAGAWSRGIEGVPPEARPPVRPLKGQMLSLRMDPAAPLLSHVVWAPGVYLVPRRDGRLLIGATVEEKGFDSDLTAGGMFDLLRDTWDVLPGIEELPIEETWVGHRPTSLDDAPILGPTPVEGLVLATGHHRNGILLAPVTADAVSRYILTGELDESIQRFGLDRFGLSADNSGRYTTTGQRAEANA